MMKGVGVHLQYSVFYCELTWPELADLKQKLAAEIKPDEDDVRVYPLPSEGRVVSLGIGDRVPEGVEVIL